MPKKKKWGKIGAPYSKKRKDWMAKIRKKRKTGTRKYTPRSKRRRTTAGTKKYTPRRKRRK